MHQIRGRRSWTNGEWIAQVASQFGFEVMMVDVQQASPKKVFNYSIVLRSYDKKNNDRRSKKVALFVSRIHTSMNLQDLKMPTIIEAATENVELKIKYF